MPRRDILDTRWSALLSDFRRSGLTHAEFCRRRGLSIHSFRKHLYQPPTPKPTHPGLPAVASVAPPFVPRAIPPHPPPPRAPPPQPPPLVLTQGNTIPAAPRLHPPTPRPPLHILHGRPSSGL